MSALEDCIEYCFSVSRIMLSNYKKVGQTMMQHAQEMIHTTFKDEQLRPRKINQRLKLKHDEQDTYLPAADKHMEVFSEIGSAAEGLEIFPALL